MIGAGIAFAGGMLATAMVATDRGPDASWHAAVLLLVTTLITIAIAAGAHG